MKEKCLTSTTNVAKTMLTPPKRRKIVRKIILHVSSAPFNS